MSFSFSFVSKTPLDAKIALEKRHAPSVIKLIIEQALAGVDPKYAVRVEASGHIPDMPMDSVHSSHFSTVQLKVEPLTFDE